MSIRPMLIAAAITVALGACTPMQSGKTVPAAVTAAVADPARPAADTQRDADRKPAELIAFAGIKAGDKGIDLLPGGGYFTRLFSKVVGPKGVVYAWVNPKAANAPANAPDPAAGVTAIAADANFKNVRPGYIDTAGKSAEAVDFAWTSLNYHDLQNRPNADLGAFNKMVFKSLKPGGIYIVIDHAAETGSGKRDSATLHRIDPSFVKAEVVKSGFVFEAESKALANPADDHKGVNRDSGIRGKTDQFVFKFRKPKK